VVFTLIKGETVKLRRLGVAVEPSGAAHIPEDSSSLSRADVSKGKMEGRKVKRSAIPKISPKKLTSVRNILKDSYLVEGVEGEDLKDIIENIAKHNKRLFLSKDLASKWKKAGSTEKIAIRTIMAAGLLQIGESASAEDAFARAHGRIFRQIDKSWVTFSLSAPLLSAFNSGESVSGPHETDEARSIFFLIGVCALIVTGTVDLFVNLGLVIPNIAMRVWKNKLVKKYEGKDPETEKTNRVATEFIKKKSQEIEDISKNDALFTGMKEDDYCSARSHELLDYARGLRRSVEQREVPMLVIHDFWQSPDKGFPIDTLDEAISHLEYLEKFDNLPEGDERFMFLWFGRLEEIGIKDEPISENKQRLWGEIQEIAREAQRGDTARFSRLLNALEEHAQIIKEHSSAQFFPARHKTVGNINLTMRKLRAFFGNEGFRDYLASSDSERELSFQVLPIVGGFIGFSSLEEMAQKGQEYRLKQERRELGY